MRKLSLLIFLASLSLVLAAQKDANTAVAVGYDTLAARLDNRDPVIRREACKLLGELGDQRAVQPLGRMIKDLDEETRWRAVEALGSLLSKDSIPFLADATRDPSRRVKLSAIEGMVTLYISTQGSGGMTGMFHRALDMVRQSGDDLIVPPGTQVDPRVINALGDTVGDPDDEAAKAAARAAGVLRGNDAVPAMAKVLYHAPPAVRIEILKAFQKIRDRRAASDVALLLGNSDKITRATAAYTLGLLGAQDQVAALHKLFEKDRDVNVRHSAFEGLSLMPPPQDGEWFIKFLGDPDDRLREYAADALGRVADASLPAGGIEKIGVQHGAEKKERVRLALAFALTAHGQTAMLGELMDALDSSLHRQYGTAYLTELGRDGSRLPLFYPYLKSDATNIRRYLCEVLGNLANPAALDFVRPLIHDPKSDVVTSAIRAVQILERYQK